ncbi:hypothetical protein PENFLA_c095G03950 [Penicillium flavigenum]|uniref:Uncharacterized protein n=1 Tax=Penicillium flavigenum TaxID=254877 RepID=A0A1V6S7M8_9EURO|nr:hypothetical protein PENFLA_c095G03950 [Penicillium flavigenum]
MGVMNSIGASICQKRLAQTTPKEWTEDPYFICHLLALAQLQERKLDLPKPTIYTSRLLVTNVLDRECILCYEAQITTELLNGLRNPKDATSPMKWPTIRRRRVPYKPYLTFAGRLVAELVAPSPLPSHGPFNPSDDVNGVFEYGRKRPREQGDNGSYIASKEMRGSFMSGLRRR